MAGKIDVGGRLLNTAVGIPSGNADIVGFGQPSNVAPLQQGYGRGMALGPYRIPQTPARQPRTPISLPWGTGNGRGIA